MLTLFLANSILVTFNIDKLSQATWAIVFWFLSTSDNFLRIILTSSSYTVPNNTLNAFPIMGITALFGLDSNNPILLRCEFISFLWYSIALDSCSKEYSNLMYHSSCS